MRNTLCLAAFLTLALGSLPPAEADKALFERTREDVEAALELTAALRTPARIRPKEPVQLTAQLVNRDGKQALKVVRPGNGCGWGIVEPHIRYTARYRATHDDPWRNVAVRTFQGMCGMGDYRWQRLVTELAPGATLDLTSRLPAASSFVDFTRPGHYEVRLHYAFRRKGTTEKLPQADAVGDLGPMRRMPAYAVVSEPIHVQIVRPLEVVVEALDRPVKGVARRLSDLVHVRLENWTGKPLMLTAKRLRLLVRLRASPQAGRVRRKPISTPAGFTVRTLPAGASAILVGPQGIYDEAWVAEDGGPVELHVTVAGVQPGAARLRSAWIKLRRP